MQKMKSHDLKGMQFHNQRERKSKTNPDIDEERTHENYDLKNEENIDYNKEVRGIIEEQKISTRKTRKDAVLVNELIVTSDRDFFEGLDSEEEKRFFKETYDLFTERYGEQNIAYATVHKDEYTPHMHLGVVPMREGRLQGKNVFNRQELLWLQDKFPKHMQEKGFDLERGEKGSDREHLSVQDYKKQQLEMDISSLENDLSQKKEELTVLNEKVPDGVKTRFAKQTELVDVPTGEKTILGKEKTTKERQLTGNIIVPEEDFKKVVLAAKHNERSKRQIKNILNTDYAQENKQLKKENTALEEENTALKESNQELKKDNHTLISKLSDLTNELEVVYENTKEFLKARTNDLQAFREVFDSWVGKVKEKLPKSEIGSLHERSEAKVKAKETEFSMEQVIRKNKELSQQKSKGKSKDMDLEL